MDTFSGHKGPRAAKLMIENFFCKLKEFKRFAMRNDKTDESFAAIINA